VEDHTTYPELGVTENPVSSYFRKLPKAFANSTPAVVSPLSEGDVNSRSREVRSTSTNHSAGDMFTFSSSSEVDGPRRGVDIHHEARNLSSQEASDSVEMNVLSCGANQLQQQQQQR
jgi:hypothetical protein